jgi:hypothetical protein
MKKSPGLAVGAPGCVQPREFPLPETGLRETLVRWNGSVFAGMNPRKFEPAPDREDESGS